MALGHRYFFCFRPPADQAKRIGKLRDELSLRGTIIKNDRLHKTLGITQDYAAPADRVAYQMMEIGGSIDAEPVRLHLDEVSGNGSTVALRPRRRPRGLRGVQSQMDRRLSRSGIRRSGWKFNPHVTLGYFKGEPFRRGIPALEWEATELILVHSVLGETRHIELGRWPLTRRQLELPF